MESFLSIVAASLYEKFGDGISHCCLVFPGRRARLFFNKALSEKLAHTVWQPASMGISQLVEQLTEQKADNPLYLVSVLYKSYCKFVPAPRAFDEFYTLGRLMLQDFDMLDKYYVDPHKLYRNIKEYKDIEQNYDFLTDKQLECVRSFWDSFNQHPNHDLNRQFMALWDTLPKIYDDFNASLTATGHSYEGGLYRLMAHNLHSDKSHTFFDRYTTFAFIGFNALNPCEQALFRKLQDKKKALFYWDYDVHYTQDKDQLQEAGMFMRENLRKFPPEVVFTQKDSGLLQPGEWEVLPVPSYVLQAKMVPQLLTQHRLPRDTRTAVVLADEELLLPLLHALAPQEQEADAQEPLSLNVTMGFPFKQTLLFSLFEQMAANNLKTLRFHPYVSALDLYKDIDTPANDPKEFTTKLLYVIDRLQEESDKLPEDKMRNAVLREGRKQINRLYAAVTGLEVEVNVKMFTRLLLTHLSQVKIPFSGEPLCGLQIMGILETRCLDFEHVILLSAQENFLPKIYKDHSLIPYNFKKAFGLPSPEQHLAMHAYYFYRLMQRARTVTFVYNNKTEGSSKGEISRFIRQMSFELPHNKIVQSRLSYQLSLPSTEALSVPKTGAVRTLLEEYLAHGRNLSVSALKTYLKCPLWFYYRELMHIREQEREEMDDSRHFGNILHRVMEVLYTPFLGKTMSKEDLELLCADGKGLADLVTRTLEEYYFLTFDPQHKTAIPGKWLLMQDAITEYVTTFVQQDALRAPTTLLALEERCTLRFKQWQFTGFLDRVEAREGRVYICDYKSGKPKNALNSVEDLFDKDYEKQNDHIFQVLFYCFLSPYATGKPVPRLYYMRGLYDTGASDGRLMYQKAPLDDTDPVKDDFLAELEALLAEIFNFELPFYQATNPKSCTYCPFVPICQRDRSDAN